MCRSSTTGPRMVWLLLLGCVVLLSVPAWLAGPSLWAAWQRHRLTRPPFPAAWRAVLRRRMPLYRRLPPGLQQQLRRHVQVFVAQVPFVGCQGLVVTDEVRVLVAAQAALLLLGRSAGTYRGLRQVLVYPAPFVVGVLKGSNTMDEAFRRLMENAGK